MCFSHLHLTKFSCYSKNNPGENVITFSPSLSYFHSQLSQLMEHRRFLIENPHEFAIATFYEHSYRSLRIPVQRREEILSLHFQSTLAHGTYGLKYSYAKNDVKVYDTSEIFVTATFFFFSLSLSLFCFIFYGLKHLSCTNLPVHKYRFKIFILHLSSTCIYLKYYTTFLLICTLTGHK
ncbi:hypothetical protein PUN28_010594 [Cardiocondyla obscurior]|uniref:Uncharacterized protein n=1 Tax=Cardiocondyla obscurior TaxID=286306 RepID=A0AAW2FL60_9HYME